jgi:excisionase family DNA binding protein
MNNDELLTVGQVSKVLGISEITVRALVSHNEIPHHFIERTSAINRQLRFQLGEIITWLKNTTKPIETEKETELRNLRLMLYERYSTSIQHLRVVDEKYKTRRPRKGYCLVKVPSKKYGYLYYVRSTENGKLIPSRWNTHTTIREEAEKFAEENRQRLIEAYKQNRKVYTMYAILEFYYQEGSSFMAVDTNRNRTLGRKTRSVYYNFIKKYSYRILSSIISRFFRR